MHASLYHASLCVAPPMQNQPALEKDQYKIRDAFVAEQGKTFIVADYGQLELRILAHIAGCKVQTSSRTYIHALYRHTHIQSYNHTIIYDFCVSVCCFKLL